MLQVSWSLISRFTFGWKSEVLMRWLFEPKLKSTWSKKLWIQSEPSPQVCRVTQTFSRMEQASFPEVKDTSSRKSINAYLFVSGKESNVLSSCQARTYIPIFPSSLVLDVVLPALYSTIAFTWLALSLFCPAYFLEISGFIFSLKESCFMKVVNKGQRTVYFFKSSSGVQLFSLAFLLLVYEKSIV